MGRTFAGIKHSEFELTIFAPFAIDNRLFAQTEAVRAPFATAEVGREEIGQQAVSRPRLKEVYSGRSCLGNQFSGKLLQRR